MAKAKKISREKSPAHFLNGATATKDVIGVASIPVSYQNKDIEFTGFYTSNTYLLK